MNENIIFDTPFLPIGPPISAQNLHTVPLNYKNTYVQNEAC